MPDCCRWGAPRALDVRSLVAATLLAAACTPDRGTAPESQMQATRDLATAAPAYEATDLGVLPGATQSRAWGMNNRGDVVGRSGAPNWGPHAVLWTRDGEMKDLGLLPGGSYSVAESVNDHREIVGYADVANGDVHAFRWDRVHGMQDLGVDAASFSAAWNVNARGVAVGEVDVDPENPHAVRWSADGRLVDLGTFGAQNSIASGINGRGDIAITLDYVGPFPAASFLLTARGERLDIPSLGANTPTITVGVNNVRDVAGASTTPNNQSHAILWSPATGTRDLGTLGGSFSIAFDANERHTTVGYSTTATRQVHAFVWTARDGLRDLGAMSGLTYSVAHFINGGGMIVGDAGPTRATVHAYRWTPVRRESEDENVSESIEQRAIASASTGAHRALEGDGERLPGLEGRRPLKGRAGAR